MTSFVLKLIAAFTMLSDHVGLILFPGNIVFRIIGRIAFPIFAYCIAEGFTYTRNRIKYFLRIFALGLICQIVYYIADGDMYLGILITFSLSIAVMACLDIFKKAVREEKNLFTDIYIKVMGKEPNAFLIKAVSFVILALSVIGCYVITLCFEVDYGFWGIMIAPLVYLLDGKWPKIIMLSVGLVFLAALETSIMNIQWYSLLAVPIIALYNGKPGKHRMKYFFYVFYPAHLALIYLISYFVR